MMCQVYNDADLPEGEPMELTERQCEDLEAQLPLGWRLEYVRVR